jgi:recA bacterial DNA recombination protein
MSSLSVRLQPATEPTAFASPEKAAALARQLATVPKLAQVSVASRLEVRPTPEMVSSGLGELDILAGGLPRGCLTEIFGPASSGRTSILLAALAAATRRQEACALVDVTDAFDPRSGAVAGVDFGRLLWVRCGKSNHVGAGVFTGPGKLKDLGAGEDTRSYMLKTGIPRSARNDKVEETKLEQALRITDLLLQSGGFGMVAIDLGDVSEKAARRIPLTSWFRFQRAVEGTLTVLLVMSRAPCAQSCTALRMKLRPSAFNARSSGETPSHTQIFEGLRAEGELLRTRAGRKPAASVRLQFMARMKWG